jgi:hypothetical protein
MAAKRILRIGQKATILYDDTVYKTSKLVSDFLFRENLK